MARSVRQLEHYQDIAVIGLGQTGLSCVRYLLNQGRTIEVFDTREQPPGLAELNTLAEQAGSDVKIHLGPLAIDQLLAMDLLVISPGINRNQLPLQLAVDAGIPLVGDVELFAWQVTKPVVAITGSNGKTTVTRLVGDLLAASGKQVAVGGNIGVPVLDLLDANYDCYVLELSSFQLESTTSLAPNAATILNISEDHFDRYTGLYDYTAAKQRIYQHAGCVVANRDDLATQPQYRLQDSQLVTFGKSAHKTDFGLTGSGTDCQITYAGQPLVAAAELSLQGIHNLLNIQAALALVHSLDVELDSVLPSLRSFKGLPHRCELIYQAGAVNWVNDSKATNIGAAQAAIEGLRPSVAGRLVLIAGGDGKGADFKTMSATCEQLDGLVTLGRDGDKIADLRPDSIRVKTLTEAVAAAAQQVGEQGTVLLSPACSSLDMFSSFEDRGQQFKAAVEDYYVAAAS